MELINLYIAILVLIYLIKAVLQSQTTLDQDLDQMIKDLVLSILHLSLLLNFWNTLHVVLIIEFLKLLELDHTVWIQVDFIEQSSYFVVLDCKVEQSREAYVEIAQT